MDPYEWKREASVTYPDWVGDVALEKTMAGNTAIYDLAGLDAEEWQIIGLDLGATRSGASHPHVIAVRKSTLGGKHIAELDSIEAVDIQLHNVDPWDLLLAIANMLDIRLRLRAVENATIAITELLDSPPQDDGED
ncbi:hypothetical protein MAUB_57360 [Mycolicibacterium aubagnense]|uniref:Uncharacterized protein n=2 Tax=Mycolicibacterium aubagnense TaxID=319707 RepID=A0ABM7IMB2_9MYCO|nr:hypothetical protein MAUB_57360 [Mycolicibacterium aubagnense]